MSLTTCCELEQSLRRHVFVWLEEEGWRGATAESGDPGGLREWIARGRPLIVRRPCVSLDGEEVHAGIALPGKRRLGFRVKTRSLRTLEPPPHWEECEALARPEVAKAVEGMCHSGASLRTFGSYAWQHLTGLPYLTEDSDVDLLAEINTPDQWNNFRRAMRKTPLPEAPRIDLEVVFRGDASFSWREFAAPGGQVLIKANRHVCLADKETLEDWLHD